MRVSVHRPQTFSIDPPDKSGSIAIALSEPASSDWVWELRVSAKGGLGGHAREVGRMRTLPPASGAHHSRVVAFASAPGACDWMIDIRAVTGTDPENCEADLDVTSCPYLMGQPWTPIGGLDWRHGSRYWTSAGTSAGGILNALVPAGVAIQTISAWDAGSAGFVTWTDPVDPVGTLPSVPIPANGSVTLGPRGSLVMLEEQFIQFTFSGAGGYVIEGLR